MCTRSTCLVRHALHEASFGSSKKQKEPLLTTKDVRCMLEFAQRHQDWTISYWYRVIFGDETMINWFQYDDRAWCWVRDGESQLQGHHASQTIEHGGGAIFMLGCMTSHGTGYMCKKEGKITQALYLNILQDGVTNTIEWYHFNLSRVHNFDPKHIAKLVKQWLSMQCFGVLTWPH